MPAELPLLRYREGSRDREYTAPAVIMGEVTGADLAVVEITSRQRPTQIYIDDLEPVLGGADMTLGLMLDAAEHRDRVKITLARDRITYENPAQAERFKAKRT